MTIEHALEAAARALVDKLDECAPHIGNAAMFMHAHGIEYTGPQYGEDLERLRAVLASAALPPTEGEELIELLRRRARFSRAESNDPGTPGRMDADAMGASADAIIRLTRERDEARIEAFRDLAAIFERDTFEGHEMAAMIARNAVALSSPPESER
jgi:hypothetical protein